MDEQLDGLEQDYPGLALRSGDRHTSVLFDQHCRQWKGGAIAAGVSCGDTERSVLLELELREKITRDF